jgi:hypothetical protein
MKSNTNSTKTTPTKAKAGSAKSSSSKKKRTGGPQGVVNALARFRQRQGLEDVPRKQVAVQVGMKPTSLQVLISNMKKNGLVECRNSETVRLTDQGLAMSNVEDAPAPVDTETVHEDIKTNVLKGKSRMVQIFDFLADGKVHKKADVMDAIGYTNKASFNVLMSQTKSTGILEYPDKDTVRLTTDMCFPLGRPE